MLQKKYRVDWYLIVKEVLDIINSMLRKPPYYENLSVLNMAVIWPLFPDIASDWQATVPPANHKP